MAKKRMYKKGSFLEPNKELKFGGPKKKGKYQAAGARGRSTNEEAVRAGTPRAEAAARARANSGSNMQRVLPRSTNTQNSSTALAMLDQSEFRSARGAAESSNRASSVAKVMGAKPAKAEPKVGDKLRELERAPGAKPGPKPGTYAYAKSRNPNLDKLIAERKKYPKGSADYNRVQNQINRAYGTGPMRTEATKVQSRPAPSNPTPKRELAGSKPASSTSAKPASKTISKPAPKKISKPAAPKPAAKKPTSTKTPSGGSGMGAVAKENALKRELQSARPVDRRAPSKNAQKIANKNARRNKRLGRMQERMDKLKGKMQAGGLKEPKPEQTGLKKLPTAVRNKMGYKMFGGYKKK